MACLIVLVTHTQYATMCASYWQWVHIWSKFCWVCMQYLVQYCIFNIIAQQTLYGAALDTHLDFLNLYPGWLTALVAVSLNIGYIWRLFLIVHMPFVTLLMAAYMTSYWHCVSTMQLNHDQCLHISQLGLCQQGCHAGNHTHHSRLATHSVVPSLNQTLMPGEIPIIIGHHTDKFTNSECNQLIRGVHSDRCRFKSVVSQCCLSM